MVKKVISKSGDILMFGGLVDDKLLASISNLKFKFNISITSQFEGQQKAKGRGNSLEFSDHREYIPGDDFRKVNFKIYAATQRLYVKLFEQERQTTYNFFIDMSKSMDFGSSTKKGDMAKALVACLCYIALSQLDGVNIFLIKEDHILHSGHFKSKQSFAKIVKFLEDAQFEGLANFDNIKNVFIPRKSISFIFSDFLFEGAENVLKILLRKSSFVYCCQVLDKLEAFPQFDYSFCELIDSESNKKVNIEISDALIKQYKHELRNLQKLLKELVQKANGRFYEILTSDNLNKILFGMVGV
ncbi:conserved hypothetical protein [Caldicellulosiruptor hydrothermalis 108]|uniref:DUF58 domain-containing protein n=1 Tax=Caldicellulosiruptor hydrothermalis (strain DSM 18901 / VKM B-2411 / 108) TaxID=632292 RepID=E4QCG4_CALH1|nr:DUF58 domain-containing protein [Caldicellulosiruptor hydrothermalis]ADQ06260.1 conserved hypothetical protein [Caldicellulosiruptor hydrothermalis 108]